MDELALIDLVFGEGTKMADELRAKGFDSLEKISQADPARLAHSLEVGSLPMNSQVIIDGAIIFRQRWAFLRYAEWAIHL